MQNQNRASSLLNEVVRYSEEHRENGSAQHLMGALALRRLGRRQEARAFVDAWLKRNPTNAAAQWSALVFDGKQARARELEQTLREGMLHRSTGDQDFVIVVDVVNMLNLN
jgi:hypothetical protein